VEGYANILLYCLRRRTNMVFEWAGQPSVLAGVQVTEQP